MAAGVAAAIGRERRRVVEVLKQAGATSADRAVAPERLGPVRFHVVARLEGHGVVRRLPDGRVYLDEPAWATYHARLHRLAFVMITIALAAMAATIAATVVRGA